MEGRDGRFFVFLVFTIEGARNMLAVVAGVGLLVLVVFCLVVSTDTRTTKKVTLNTAHVVCPTSTGRATM